MDDATLTRLVQGEHLSMDERIKLGLWPHPPIPIDVVIRVAVKALMETGYFPRRPVQTPVNAAIPEQGTIERVGPDHFIYKSQRSFPTKPNAVADSIERSFDNADDAARFYLKWDLHLPGDLDGWKVV